jgi:anti-sigma factor RsiW
MVMSKEKVTDLDIQALVDDELSGESLAAVEERVRESPLFQKRYADIKNQNDLLKLWWASAKRTT